MSAILIWPAALNYTNELWGGIANGYRVMTDSNYDWGQGLKELVAWQEQHPERELRLWYFGPPAQMLRLPAHEVAGEFERAQDADDLLAVVHGNYIAVSTSIVSAGPVLKPPLARALRFVQTHALAARTTTFFIYDCTYGPEGLAGR
jgi:hypothetical protein